MGGGRCGFQHDPDDPHTLRDNDVWVLFEDSDAALWVGTYGGGLSRLRDGGWRQDDTRFEHFRHDRADPASLSSDVVRSLHEDSAGRLWIGTDNGLNRLDDRRSLPGEARFVRFRHEAGNPGSLAGNEVLSILEGRTGSLWVGTHGGGLSRLVEGGAPSATFRSYTSRDGLPSDVVYGILEDDRGRLWVTFSATGSGSGRCSRTWWVTPSNSPEIRAPRTSKSALGLTTATGFSAGCATTGSASIRSTRTRSSTFSNGWIRGSTAPAWGWIESAGRGRGTTFFFTLPRAAAALGSFPKAAPKDSSGF